MRYIAPRYDNFELHYEIFDKIFHRLHLYMKNVDRYYMHYSSPVSNKYFNFDFIILNVGLRSYDHLLNALCVF